MASQIGWIDFSPKHRDRVRKFMDLMGDGGVVDELGVRVIRDNMSNKLFPGFSTLYTRAKYFFITPYILLDWFSGSRRSLSGMDYFRKSEVDINHLIIDYYALNDPNGEESYFGKNKKDGDLKRQPSEIYWAGMYQLKLIREDTSLPQILNHKRSLMEELLSNYKGDDTITKETGEYKGGEYVNVSYDKKWREVIKAQGLLLTRTEAETLRDRLCKEVPDSLPAALMTNDKLWALYQDTNGWKDSQYSTDNSFVHFIDCACPLIKNSKLKANLMTAHDLAIFLHGAHIAYNIQLWSRVGGEDARRFVEQVRQDGRYWFNELSDHMINSLFKIEDCMNERVKSTTRRFLINMQHIIAQSSSWDDMEKEFCLEVEKQERWNKKNKSRFMKLDNRQVIDDVNANHPAWLGLGLIGYRYSASLSVIKDIYEGLHVIES